jgi:DNA-binding GntR family transcriptional regulator
MSELMAAHHQRYRRGVWDYSTRAQAVGDRFSDQHADLARLTIDHDADAAAALLAEHYTTSVEALIAHWRAAAPGARGAAP